jgi:thiosulfate dehydrogenase
MRRVLAVSFVGALSTISACTTEVVNDTPESRGLRAAREPRALSPSQFNAFSCATCHALPGAEDDDRILPGAPLGGAVARTSFWGGRYLTLGEAVTECVTHFQRARAFDPATPEARDLYAYLTSIRDLGPASAQPFTVTGLVADLKPGDSARGREVWRRACQDCHGDIRTGRGRLAPYVSLVPDETIAFHSEDGPDVVRLVVIEKVRHGSYLGFGGTMPPFSQETLSDEQIADLLAYLQL